MAGSSMPDDHGQERVNQRTVHLETTQAFARIEREIRLNMVDNIAKDTMDIGGTPEFVAAVKEAVLINAAPWPMSHQFPGLMIAIERAHATAVQQRILQNETDELVLLSREESPNDPTPPITKVAAIPPSSYPCVRPTKVHTSTRLQFDETLPSKGPQDLPNYLSYPHCGFRNRQHSSRRRIPRDKRPPHK